MADDDAPREPHRKVNRAVAWVGLASSLVALFDVITVGVLLAFWVTTRDLGAATLAVSLFYFLDLATEAGLSSVLIQRATLDDDLVSSVFWLNLAVSCALFGAMFVLAPLVGRLQGQTAVGTMLLVYATKLVYQNLYFVPSALLRRELRFKEISVVRTVANLGDVAGRIGFAAAGYPVWCFVAGPLARIAITGIGLQLYRPWRPRFVFQRGHVREWLAYGAKTTGSQMLQHLYSNVGYQVVGFFYGDSLLGVYRIAYELVLYPVNFITNVVSQVSFPAFSRIRNDRKALADQFMRFSRQNLAMALPILVLIAVAADDLVAVLFPRITGAGTIARVLCVVGMFRAVDCLYLPLLDAVGLAGRNLMIAGIAVVILIGGDIAVSMTLKSQLGLLAIALGRIVGYPLVIGLHAYLTLSQLELRTATYLRKLFGILACGVLAALPGIAIEQFGGSLAPVVRVLLVSGLTLGSVALALQYFQNLGPKTVLDEIRRSKNAPAGG